VASNPAFLPEKIEEASMNVFQKFAIFIVIVGNYGERN
jgi:hypothetical protein